jgi:hypothetical protein
MPGIMDTMDTTAVMRRLCQAVVVSQAAVVEAAAAVAAINTPKSPFFMILSSFVYISCFFR